MLELDHDSKIFSSLDPPRLLCAQQRRTQIEYSIEAQSQSQPQTDIVRITIITIGISVVIVTIVATSMYKVVTIIVITIIYCSHVLCFDPFSYDSIWPLLHVFQLFTGTTKSPRRQLSAADNGRSLPGDLSKHNRQESWWFDKSSCQSDIFEFATRRHRSLAKANWYVEYLVGHESTTLCQSWVANQKTKECYSAFYASERRARGNSKHQAGQTEAQKVVPFGRPSQLSKMYFCHFCGRGFLSFSWREVSLESTKKVKLHWTQKLQNVSTSCGLMGFVGCFGDVSRVEPGPGKGCAVGIWHIKQWRHRPTLCGSLSRFDQVVDPWIETWSFPQWWRCQRGKGKICSNTGRKYETYWNGCN